MNFTVDDSDPSISYSPNGWALQSQNDPDLDQFFQQTYHVATQDGATMSFQFSGSAFTLYGSKGPSHAAFQLQFDGTIVNLDASAQTTAFRQELFTHSFSPNGTAAQHLVKVTAVLEGKNKWLDLDYITFTSGSGSTSSIGTATSAPPWLTDSSTSPTGPSGFTIKLPTILAALFGALVALALLGVLAWLVLRRVLARHRARERAFRYGQSSVNPAAAAGPGPADPSSIIKGGYPPSATSASASASAKGSGPLEFSALMMRERERERERTTSPYSQTQTQTQRDGSMSFASNAVEMRSASIDERERERERVGTPATGTALSGTGTGSRGLMSQSPIVWTTRKMGGGHRGDADSFRTDFLQV
ncbi:hypothetical protein LXA43DRAFT_1064157 [Ganoderma leucocontextum]|nr:hypothetical protein LXA43DRAFT_1064157 [Ganoderma leucocontextum]